jgi:rSAM/selenodomain-associated transferase 1
VTTRADCIIAVFAKAPRPGEVKTRLIPLLGAQGACALHRKLVAHSLSIARAAGVGAVELWCTPDASNPILRQYAAQEGASLLDQGQGTLGERMDRTFQAMLARAARCILIGSDCASLTAKDLADADTALAEPACDAVFTPAEDGGYVLVGLNRPRPAIFVDIAWGSGDVMQQTRARLRQQSLTWRELPVRWDVDRPEDYERLVRFNSAFLVGHQR